jgi:hypothetical protein
MLLFFLALVAAVGVWTAHRFGGSILDRIQSEWNQQVPQAKKEEPPLQRMEPAAPNPAPAKKASPGQASDKAPWNKLFTTPADDPAGTKRMSMGPLNHKHLRHAQGNPLLMIRGEVTNQYDHPRRFIQVRAFLQDDQQNILSSREVYGGNVIDEKYLVRQPYAQILLALMKKEGQGGRNNLVPAGGSLPFMLVFNDLPPKMATYTVEVFRSEPVTGP